MTNDPIQANRFKRELHEYYVDIVWGFVCGDGHIAGRMASGAPGAIDPTEPWQPLAEEYRKRGFNTRAAIAADMKRRWAEADSADEE
ncbi:hypothetical protein [Leptolyngbya sp. ST-U4]|uniref:hypothetical protein n=1 Tax=Leptolyngbya sp. ST-U4 TaxID=2933912 RepID=UPI0019B6D96D|nr:hypothetical protein [Cyanobacteria bacterium FACHB-502]